MVENKFIKFVISMGICLFAGYFSSLYAIPLLPSYFVSLKKPDFLVPVSSFVPIGVVVYLLMGFTMFFIWKSDTNQYHEKQVCILLFLSSLVLNVLWFYSFFGLRSPTIGLLVMIMLFAILVSTMYQTVRVSFGATLLLVPYLVVTFFVAYMNYAIVNMNPALPFFQM
jgi:tryptophan-rich sensory protein